MELHPQATASLRNLLEVPGLLRGGALYGYRKRDTLQVILAAPAGYLWWLPGADPLAMDERYTLGWADCLSALYGSEVQWCGQWLMYPHRQLGTVEQDLHWLRAAHAQGLTDIEHPLLIVGWEDGRMSATATFLETIYGQPTTLPVRIGPGAAPSDESL